MNEISRVWKSAVEHLNTQHLEVSGWACNFVCVCMYWAGGRGIVTFVTAET